MAGYRFLFSMMVIFSCLTPAAAQTPAPSCPDEQTLTLGARTALVKAQNFMTEKKMPQAAQALEAFIREHPDENHAYVAYTLGCLYLELDRAADALIQFEKTADLCPAYAPAWQNLAKVCFDLRQYSRAGMALEKSWDLTGRSNHMLYFQAAVAHISAKTPEKALPVLAFLCSGRAGAPKENWVTLYVQTAIEQKRSKRAVKTVEQLLTQPEPAPFLFRLATVLYLEIPDYRKAAQNLEAYGLVTALQRDEQKLLADLYANLGIPAKAAQNYEKVIAIKPCCTIFEQTASCWFEACEYDKALDAAEKGLAAYPESKRLWQVKGWVHYEKQDFSPAARAFGKACALDSRDINTLFLHGLCACRAGDRDSARKALTRAACHNRYKTRALALIHEMESGNI